MAARYTLKDVSQLQGKNIFVDKCADILLLGNRCTFTNDKDFRNTNIDILTGNRHIL